MHRRVCRPASWSRSVRAYSNQSNTINSHAIEANCATGAPNVLLTYTLLRHVADAGLRRSLWCARIHPSELALSN